MRKFTQKAVDSVTALIGGWVGGEEMFRKTETFRKGLDRYLACWTLAIGAMIVLVILGNLWCIWVGVILGAILAMLGSLRFVSSSRYLRDIWKLESEIIIGEDEESRARLRYEIVVKRGYVETERMWGMASLALAGGVFGLTMLVGTIVNRW